MPVERETVLAEILADLASAGGRGGLELAAGRLAECVSSDAWAIVRHGEIVASAGQLELPGALVDGASVEADMIIEPQEGGFVAILPVGGSLEPLHVVIWTARPYSEDEISWLRAFHRVVPAAFPLARALDRERELRRLAEEHATGCERNAPPSQARALLDELSHLQQTIARQAPLDEVFDAIVEGARRLTGDEIAALRLVDAEDPLTLVAVAWRGVRPAFRSIRRARAGEGASGLAFVREELVVLDDYGKHVERPSRLAESARSAMAVPVREHGSVIGSLVVASRSAGRTYSPGEQEVFAAFADHASLALAAARAVDTLRLAFTDALTGLPNRALLLDRLEHALARADCNGTTVTVLLLDLDRFKVVNDSLGHLAGDEVLVETARRLTGCLRPGDTAARIGGDEFAIILRGDTDARNARQIARRVTTALEEPLMVSGREIVLRVSVGIATGREEAKDLVRNADVAMYAAKTRGGGRFDVFEPEMHEAVVRRLELEANLRQALARGEMQTSYQPIVALDTGAVVGAEALLRWHHPEHGVVAPSEFIPIAEEIGLMTAIGRHVLATACDQLAAWRELAPEGAPEWVSVNVGTGHLQRGSLADDVRDALEASGIDPGSLILEITETAAAVDVDAAARMLRRLRKLGVKVAIDDFGTGYSSLRYVRRLPADFLKIARVFVEDLGSAESRALAQTIVHLGENLGLKTIAEGIEHERQRSDLMNLGCVLGQGFLLGRPAGAHALSATLARQPALAA